MKFKKKFKLSILLLDSYTILAAMFILISKLMENQPIMPLETSTLITIVIALFLRVWMNLFFS